MTTVSTPRAERKKKNKTRGRVEQQQQLQHTLSYYAMLAADSNHTGRAGWGGWGWGSMRVDNSMVECSWRKPRQATSEINGCHLDKNNTIGFWV